MAESGAPKDDASNLRTPGEIVIKTITTHLFAVGNYAYMSALQQRPTRTNIHALRVVVFTFLPTLIIVEFANSFIRSLIKFILNQINEDEEEKNVWFHLSAGLGLHASMPIKNSTTKKEDIHRIPLLKLDPTFADHERIKWSWTWAGKMLATLFALTQAIGTIVMYVRRLEHGWPLDFDHRNGAMGIASTICGIFSILVLLLRFDWSVGRALQSLTTEELYASGTTLILQVFLAMAMHQLIAFAINFENEWLYSSVGSLFFLFGLNHYTHWNSLRYGGWQTILLAILLVVFRKEIGSKIGVDTSKYQTWLGHRSLKRIKVLLKACFIVWVAVDILKLFVRDVLDIVKYGDDGEYMWQDPVSDKLFVI